MKAFTTNEPNKELDVTETEYNHLRAIGILVEPTPTDKGTKPENKNGDS